MEYAIKAIRQRCDPEDNWPLNILECWFYTIKALICMALRRPAPAAPWDEIHVAYTNGGSYWSLDDGKIYWYEALVVGHGVFTNWRYTVYQDGG